MKPNEIVTVYAAFTDKNGGKRRPILVVSDKEDRVEFLESQVNMRINQTK